MVKQFRIGYTGITWPGTQVEEALVHLAALGYRGFETFGRTLEMWEERPGGFGALIEKHGLPLVSAYCSGSLIDPLLKEQDIEQILRWAGLLKGLGGSVVVLGARGNRREQYTKKEYEGLVRTVNDIGHRLLDLGLLCCFHPHTGTPVETQEEIDIVLGSIDPDAVFFAPDVGQIQKGGSDPLPLLRKYGSLIRHMHLKDYGGGAVTFDPDGKEIDPTGYAGYVPLGQGIVDIPAIVAFLEEIDYDDWLMVELDGTAKAPLPPEEAAGISKRYLQDKLGQTFERTSGHP
jgi:inosose dehydratase